MIFVNGSREISLEVSPEIALEVSPGISLTLMECFFRFFPVSGFGTFSQNLFFRDFF